MTLEPGDFEALSKQTPAELAAGWKLLNSWDWPNWLPNPELTHGFTLVRSTRRWAAMRYIVETVGFKACVREWNAGRMTDEEFEIFWKERTLSDVSTVR